MKKLIYLVPLTLFALSNATSSYADGHGWGHGHGRHHGHHHGHHHHGHHYYPRPQVTYIYPAPPPVVQYYPAPQVGYYAPPPVYSNPYNQRSTQGLAGGVIGSVFGYELGNGDPVATGLGAAAGSYLGNGVGRGY